MKLRLSYQVIPLLSKKRTKRAVLKPTKINISSPQKIERGFTPNVTMIHRGITGTKFFLRLLARLRERVIQIPETWWKEAFRIGIMDLKWRMRLLSRSDVGNKQ